MRMRETLLVDTFDPNGAKLERYRASDGTILNTQLYAAGSVMRKKIEDEVTPGFAALQKCGKFLPLNPVRIITESYTLSKARVSGYPVGQTWRIRGELGPTTGMAVPRWDTLFKAKLPVRDDALSDAVVLAAMANAVAQRWDVATFLAELRSSVETFERLARLFNRKTLEAAKLIRRARRSPADAWKAFREEWLYWRYGIRPIVYDIKSIAETMKNIVDNQLLLIGRGHQTQDLIYQHSYPPAPGPYGVFTSTITDAIVGERTYRGASYIPIAGAMGTISLDPLQTLYELLPYSFVVDKFIDIGAWVSVLLPSFHGEFAGTCQSFKTVYRGTRTHTYVPSPFDHGSTVGGVAVETYEQEEYVRVPFLGNPPFPGFDFRVNAPFALDLVALFVRGRNNVTQALGRRR